jgi:hypothetical protein
VPLKHLKARPQVLLDDVPSSIRSEFAQRRRAALVDGVPVSIRRNLEQRQQKNEDEDKLKRKR